MDFIEMTPMLPVADIERSARFYRDVLGFSEASRSEHIALLRHGPVSLYLVPESPPTPDKPGVTIARRADASNSPVNLTFRVADVRAVHEALAARGVDFLAPGFDRPRSNPGARSASSPAIRTAI
jgi:catechol 2,3-dioxygenase-like lactoylglutathione lyase family enzyme